MKKNKKKIIVTTIILLILIIIFVIILFIKNKPKENLSDKVKYVDDIVQNVFYNKNITKNEIEETIQGSLIEDFVFIGKDSSIRHLPKNNLVKKYKLNKYVSAQNKYSKKVENTAKKNIEYRVEKELDDAIVYKIKPWYAFNYSIDIDYLKEYIMNDAGFKVTPKNNSTEKYGTNELKARTIAMKILDSKLDDYNNEDEILTLTFVFNKDKPDDHQLLSLYFNMQGVTSKRCIVKLSEEEVEKEKEKLKGYLKEAEEQGIYDPKNPYKL